MQSRAKSVEEYIGGLPEERRAAIEAVRRAILENLPRGFEERMQYGMICYVVPLSRYPAGYLGDKKTPLTYASLASQKNHMALYLMGIYADRSLAEWFAAEYKKTGKRMDMGKSCVRFRKLEDLPLGLIGEAVAKATAESFILMYEKGRKGGKGN
ncbi:MAG: DUF1801 domain-containing protein [Candidatus Micrarchaeota archaeon]